MYLFKWLAFISSSSLHVILPHKEKGLFILVTMSSDKELFNQLIYWF